jgi:hypothetical protein
MARAVKFTNPQDQEIFEVHRQFIAAMEARLDSISDDTKTNYLRILRSLTGKLALPTKPLSEIVGEMMTEAGPLLFQAMQR